MQLRRVQLHALGRGVVKGENQEVGGPNSLKSSSCLRLIQDPAPIIIAPPLYL